MRICKILLVFLFVVGLSSQVFATDRRIIYSGANELSINSDGGALAEITNAVEQKGHATFGTTCVLMTGNIATPIMVTAQACKRAIVHHRLNATGDIVVGDSNVNDGCNMLSQEYGFTDFDYVYEGITLDAGDSVILYVDNLSDIYLTTNDATGELVTVSWEN